MAQSTQRKFLPMGVIDFLHYQLTQVNPLYGLDLRMNFNSQTYRTIYNGHINDELIKIFITEGATVTREARRTVRSIMFGVANAWRMISEHEKFTNYIWSPAPYKQKRQVPIGETYEFEVKQLIEDTMPYTIIDSGILVNKHLPFMCVQPDGIVLMNGEVRGLLEIKSIKEVTEFRDLKRPPITCDPNTGKLTLSTNSKAYSQIQLSLLITGLNMCLLTVYLPHATGKKIASTVIWRDSNFMRWEAGRIIDSFKENALPILETKRIKYCKYLFDEEYYIY